MKTKKHLSDPGINHTGKKQNRRAMVPTTYHLITSKFTLCQTGIEKKEI